MLLALAFLFQCARWSAAESQPMPEELAKQYILIKEQARSAYYNARFDEERKLRLESLRLLQPWDGMDGWRTRLTKDYLQSVEAVLALPFEAQNRVVEARFQHLAAERLFYERRSAACLPLYRKALAIYEETMPENDVWRLDLRWHLAAGLGLQGAHAEAVAALQPIAEEYERRYGDAAASIYNDIAVEQGDAGDLVGKLETLKTTVPMAAAAWGDNSFQFAGFTLNVAVVANDLERFDTGLAAARMAAPRLARLGGVPGLWTVRARLEEARALAGLEKEAEAADALNAAIAALANSDVEPQLLESSALVVQKALQKHRPMLERLGRYDELVSAVGVLAASEEAVQPANAEVPRQP